MGTLTRILTPCVTLLALMVGLRAEGAIISFDFSADATQANIATIYPDWAFLPGSPSDTVVVTGGQLRLGGDQAIQNRFQLLLAPIGSFALDVDLGAFPGDPSRNIAVEVGQNNIFFHPGTPGTLLHVDGPGGFPHTDVGFTLAENVLHHFRLTGDGLGFFTITLTDSLNASNTYVQSFSNLGSVGGLLALNRGSVPGTFGELRADNFVLNQGGDTDPIPEPSTLTLLTLGTLGLARSARGRGFLRSKVGR